MNITLATIDDASDLEPLLRACGAHVTTVRPDALGQLAQPSAPQPDALVVDVRRTGVLPTMLASIKRQHPGTALLAVLAGLEPALMLEAMRAGVNECLTGAVTLDELRNALERIAALRSAAPKGEVFAVVGAKGGVGATTVAVNLATMLAKLRPGSTLLIDLHLACGDAALFLAAEPRFSVLDALANAHRLDAALLKGLVAPTASGVHLLASADKPFAAVDAARLQQLIELAASQYAYVVVDAARTDAAVLEALAPASAIIVVANQEVATVRSAGRVAETLQRRYGRDRVNVVVTRYDHRAEIGQHDVEQVVGGPVRHVFPNNYAIAVTALNKGRPLVLDNHNTLSSAFSRFARTLAGLPEPPSNRTGGLLGRGATLG